MWHTFEWLGLPFGFQEQVIVRRNMMYTNSIKRQAFKAVSSLGLYHALHVRRGDYMVLDVFEKNGRPPLWFADRFEHAPGPNCANCVNLKAVTKKMYVMTSHVTATSSLTRRRHVIPRYVLTDETDDDFFEPIRGRGFELVFSRDLPVTIMKWIENNYPLRMKFDVLGMIEQIIATWSYRFLGTSYSTFTGFILRLRKYRLILGQDTLYTRASGLGMPPTARNLTHSTCRPLKLVSHAKPC